MRTAVRLIRLGGASSATELATQLRDVSGIEELRRLLTSLFGQRRDVLKACAALTALDAVVRAEAGERAEDVLAEMERIVSSAHELTELRIVAAIRGGLVALRPDELAEVERLFDQPGAALCDRLGTPAGNERATLLAAVDRWRARSEHPMSSRPVVKTARAVVRTLEGLLHDLDG